jgi:hypothetical protein
VGFFQDPRRVVDVLERPIGADPVDAAAGQRQRVQVTGVDDHVPAGARACSCLGQ